MKIKTILLITFYVIGTLAFGQFTVTIDPPTGNPCVDSVVQFTAVVTDGGAPVDDATFKWSFEDGSIETGLNMDTVEHTFDKGGGYFVKLEASKGADTDYALLKFEVALTPNFSGTKSNQEEPICKGQQILLTGVINDSTWVYEVPDKNEEESAVIITDTSPYNSIFDYRIFTKSQTITVATDIDSIGINLEHADLSQVKIELICPDNTSILLKGFGGAPGKYFGEPNLASPENSGTGYDYFWTNSPDNGTMNSVTPTGDALLSGSYAPDEGFDLLIGCPLNGEWTIKVTDNQTTERGFIFSTQLTFNASLLPADWEYSHTYGFPEWIGNGVHSTSGEGLATANPELYGNEKYTYKVQDNFGCYQDTSLFQTIEGVNIKDTIPPLYVEDTIRFVDETSWANEFLWDFGDGITAVDDSISEHVYESEGFYTVLLTAKNDECEDTASVLIQITIPPFNIPEIPTAFSPDGSGTNDNFYLPKGEGIMNIKGFIYSRWGKKVAEWNSIEDATNNGWDGNIKGGQKASPGVYFYYIEFTSYDGVVEVRKGSVHLFRNN